MTDETIATWPAPPARGRDRRRRALQPGAARPLPRPHRAAQRAGQRGRDPRRRTGARRGRRGRRRTSPAATASGPLHGLPITIKDAIETAGIRSTGGARRAHRSRARRRRAGGRPAQGRGRDRVRQDQRAALVGRPPDLQRRSSAPRTTRGRSTGRPAARRAARPPRWRAGSPASSSAPTSAARCASRRTAAACSGSSRASAWSRSAATSTTWAAARPTPTSTCSVRSPAAPTTSSCSSTCSPAPSPSAPRLAARPPARPARVRSAIYRVGVWFDDPACAGRPEYLRHAARRGRPAGRRRRQGRATTHPPVDFAEQRDLFMRMIVPAIAPSIARRPIADGRRRRVRTSRGCAPRRSGRALRRSVGRVVRGLRPAAVPGRCRSPAFPHDHERRHGRAHARDQRRDAPYIDVIALARAHRRRRAAVGGPPDRPHRRRAAGRHAGRRAVPPRPRRGARSPGWSPTSPAGTSRRPASES